MYNKIFSSIDVAEEQINQKTYNNDYSDKISPKQ